MASKSSSNHRSNCKLSGLSPPQIQSLIQEIQRNLHYSNVYVQFKQLALEEAKALSENAGSVVVSNTQFVNDLQHKLQKSPHAKSLVNKIYRELKFSKLRTLDREEPLG